LAVTINPSKNNIMKKLLKETILWILILLPLVYLAKIWDKLPEIVPTHFNNNGIANGWSQKTTLLAIVFGMGVGFYFIMLIIPYLDPRKNLRQMGHKYYNIRFIITFFISLITIFIIYSSNGGSFKNPNTILLICGTIFIILGIIFFSIKPNNFIGFRTTWAMESDSNWNKTHQLAAPLLILGGGVLDACPIISPHKAVSPIIVLGIVAITMLTPIIYSYIVFKEEEQE
jgi:uncharacterized membrane protein